MDSLLETVELNRETTQALDEIRSGAENALYGMATAEAEEQVNRLVMPLIEGSGLPNLQVIHFRWYLREVARLWRTRKGRDLAFHLELCIRKWVGLGLEPRTLQFLICEAHQRLKAGQQLTANSLPPSASTQNPGTPEPRNPGAEGTAKDAKIAKSEPDSDTRPLESSIPGPLSSSTPGPLSHSTPGVL